MHRLLGYSLAVVFLVGCSETSDNSEVVQKVERTPLSEETPEAFVARWFDTAGGVCRTDADCPSGVCDRETLVYLGDAQSLCITFDRAFYRWQKVLLARRLADEANTRADLRLAVAERLSLLWEQGVLGGEAETLVLIASALGGPEALDFLNRVVVESVGPGAREASLALMRLNPTHGYAIDTVLESATSSLPEQRLKAAWALGESCSEAWLSELISLAVDAHPQVRQGALLSLRGCGRGLREAVVEGAKARRGESVPDGDEWLWQTALSDAE